jgi:hypothetical protein
MGLALMRGLIRGVMRRIVARTVARMALRAAERRFAVRAGRGIAKRRGLWGEKKVRKPSWGNPKAEEFSWGRGSLRTADSTVFGQASVELESRMGQIALRRTSLRPAETSVKNLQRYADKMKATDQRLDLSGMENVVKEVSNLISAFQDGKKLVDDSKKDARDSMKEMYQVLMGPTEAFS